MKLSIVSFFMVILFSSSLFAGDFKIYSEKTEMTYAQTLEYCLEDGDDWTIPNKALLARVIVVGDLQDIDRWFWSSTKAPSELCSDEVCYYQVHTKTLSERVRSEKELGHGICVYYETLK